METYSVVKQVPLVILDSVGNIVIQLETRLELRFICIKDSIFDKIGFEIYMEAKLQNEKIRYTSNFENTFMDFFFKLYQKTKYQQRYLVDPSDSTRLNVPVKDSEDIISALTEHAINLYNKWFKQTGEIVVDESGRMIE